MSRPHRTARLPLLALALPLAAACIDGDPATPDARAPIADASALLPDAASAPDAGPAPRFTLDLLPAGNHAGMIVGFNAEMPVITAVEADARWQQAIAAGMRVGRVQIDWIDLEPSPSNYAVDELRELLEPLSDDGLSVFLTFHSLAEESDEYALPTDLAGKAFDDPEVLARYRAVLDWVVPMMVEHGGFAISVGNELGNFLDDLPATEQTERARQVRAFVAAARDHVHSIEPRMAVTISVREHFTVELEAPYLAELIAETDFATFNWYCNNDRGFDNETDPEKILEDLDVLLKVAGDREIVIQEFGCPAGHDDRPSKIGATPELQRQFYDVVLARLDTEPRLRAVIAFQLVDWGGTSLEVTVQTLRDEGLHDLADQYEESLGTLGFIRYADGVARPAWQVFLDAL